MTRHTPRTTAGALGLLISTFLLLVPAPPAAAFDGASDALGLRPRVAKHWCGTHKHRSDDEGIVHRMNLARLEKRGTKQGSAVRNVDVGNLSVVEDDDSIVIPANDFDFEKNTAIVFTPTGETGFSISNGRSKFQKGGEQLTGFTTGSSADPTDDGFEEVPFTSGFRFPFYGREYSSMFVGTNGFVTFGSGDFNSPAIVSAAALRSEQPRIAAFWTDLDVTNSGGIFVKRSGESVTITWKKVPLYGKSGSNTFQMRLFDDGRVTFIYKRLTDDAKLVGLSPGADRAELQPVDMTAPETSSVIGAPFEVYASLTKVDVVALAQAFYKTHGDDYDFLYTWTDFPTSLDDAFAYYAPISNQVRGIGQAITDGSSSYGSGGRLQGLLNLNRPDLYPSDPNQLFLGLNSPLSIFGQEQGHRWGAYVRFRSGGADSEALLGRDESHWSFNFNTESTLSTPARRYSSCLEGNAIDDLGGGNFVTVEQSVNFYSELDQYLMGIRPAAEVRDMFLVTNAVGTAPGRAPSAGVTFTGTRKKITIDDIILAEGPRDPDASSERAQRSFRAAWILLVQKGTSPSAATLQKLETFRTSWEAYFNQALEGRATLSTELVTGAR